MADTRVVGPANQHGGKADHERHTPPRAIATKNRLHCVVTMRVHLESALSEPGTTVTTFLEQLVGEPVDAHDRRHQMIPAGLPNLLGVEEEGHPLLQRSTVLTGRVSNRPYLHAESLLVPSRLPAGFCRQLETGSDPIGRILAREGVGLASRSALVPQSTTAHVFDELPELEYLLVRRYRVEINEVAVAVISEWFLRTRSSAFCVLVDHRGQRRHGPPVRATTNDRDDEHGAEGHAGVSTLHVLSDRVGCVPWEERRKRVRRLGEVQHTGHDGGHSDDEHDYCQQTSHVLTLLTDRSREGSCPSTMSETGHGTGDLLGAGPARGVPEASCCEL